MKILLLGASGQVGWELRRTLSVLGEIVACTRDASADRRLDVADLDDVRRTLDVVTPDVIVNAAAYTAVDKAQSEPELARRINGEMPSLLGDWAARQHALVMHYSTDYVFDGGKVDAYVETDAPAPINVYGDSKRSGDEALLASGCDALILRVAWVYGRRGSNFLLTMQRLMAERDKVRVVSDQIGAPTWSRSVAQATAAVLARLPTGADRRARCGVYHLAPQGEASWYDFAVAIRDASGFDCSVEPIPSSEYPTLAGRPANSRLDSDKLAHTFGVRLPHWRHDLDLCLAD